MQIDIPLAGWILSVITFVLGTIVPQIYQKLYFEGISLKQPFSIRAVIQNEQDRNAGIVIFATVVKIANIRKDSLLLDAIRVKPFKVQNCLFKLVAAELKFCTPGRGIYLPPSVSTDGPLDYLPLIIKPDEERLLALGLHLQSVSKRDTVKLLADYIEASGLPVSFRMNGKYRDYILHIKSDEGLGFFGISSRTDYIRLEYGLPKEELQQNSSS